MNALRFGALALAAAALAATAFAGGPLAADGTTARRYASASFPLTYRVDRGGLGAFTNTTATSIVTYSFREWDSVVSAAISFNAGTQLARDVTTATDAYITGTAQWSDGVNPIVFDSSGAITDGKLGVGARNSVLGFAASAWTGTTFVEGYAIINGALSGNGSTSDEEIYKGTITHEIGHFLGLAHSQVALCADYVTMYPYMHGSGQMALHSDDTAAIAALYPVTGYSGTVGAISGTVRKADGTNLSGVVVIAVDSATGAGFSSVVDYYSGNNTSAFTNRPTASGSYTIGGLRPGRYYVKLEPIKSEFSGGSSIASYSTPINTSTVRDWYNGANESGDMLADNQNEKTAVTVTAGSTTTGVNMVMNESSTLSSLIYHNGTPAVAWSLPSATYTKYAIRMTAPTNGSLVGVKVRIGSTSTLPATGSLTVSVHANATGSLAGVPGTVLGSVTIPYRDLSADADNEIWLRGLGLAVNFNSGDQFHVSFATGGTGTVVLLSDNGTPVSNRSSYYTTASGWRNFPDGRATGSPAYNLIATGIFSSSVAGNPTPEVTLSSSALDFGRVRPNVAVDRTVTLTNSGTGTLSVMGTTIGGADSAGFSIVSNGGAFSLGVGSSRTVTVRFQPTRSGRLGSKSATLSFASNAASSPDVVALTGTFVDPIASPTASSIDFGRLRIDTSLTQTLPILRNTGNDTLNISSVSLSGADGNGAVRLLSPGGSTRLAPDSLLTARLEWTPRERRAFTASLTVSHDDSVGSTVLPISGTGVAPLLSLASDTLKLPDTRVMAAGESTAWIRNSGNAPMSIRRWSYVGADSTSLSILAPPLPAVVAAGDSVLLRVRFTPPQRRAYGVTLRVHTDALPATADLPIVGRGIAPIASAPSTLDVGSVLVGRSDTTEVEILNLGDAPLEVTSLALEGPFALDYSVVPGAVPGTIEAGGRARIGIRFAPHAAGLRTAALRITTDDPSNATMLVAISGVALQGRGRFARTIDFGDVITSARDTALLINDGTGPLTVLTARIAGDPVLQWSIPFLSVVVQTGDTLRIPIEFRPTAPGSASSTLTLTTDGEPMTLSVTATGRGVAPGLSLNRSSIDFGRVSVAAARADSVALRNTGTVPIDVSLTLEGVDAAAFTVDAPWTGTLAPGASRQVVVRLMTQPPAGPRTATLRVAVAGGEPRFVTLSALVVESMLRAPVLIDFGRRPDGAVSDTTVDVLNVGASVIRVDSIRITSRRNGIAGNHVVVTAPAPLPLSIPSSAEMVVTVRLDARAGAGVYDGTLTIFTNNPGDSAVVIELRAVVEGTTGVESLRDGDLSLGMPAPNPASASFTVPVDGHSSGEVAITLLDRLGRLVARREVLAPNARRVTFDVAGIASGEYIVVASSGSRRVVRRVVVVR